MSSEVVGTCGLLALLFALALGVPIAVALGLVGALGLSLLISPEAALIKTGVTAFDAVSSYELGVLPLFLLMAHLCFAAGATQKFFDVAAKLVGHMPGGLALAAIAGCAGFGAVSGSSLATAATVGLVALPEMRRHDYAPALATGALAAGGTLGALIPPSAALIVYGVIAEQSIGKLFIAALVPGLTQALFYLATIYLVCRVDPKLGPPIARAGSDLEDRRHDLRGDHRRLPVQHVHQRQRDPGAAVALGGEPPRRTARRGRRDGGRAARAGLVSRRHGVDAVDHAHLPADRDRGRPQPDLVRHLPGADISLNTIFRGVVPFLCADFVHLALVIAVPSLALWLPGMLGM